MLSVLNFAVATILTSGSRRLSESEFHQPVTVNTRRLNLYVYVCTCEIHWRQTVIRETVKSVCLTAMTGTVAAAGISQLQHIDLNSNRNLFVIGLSIMFGMAFPLWLREHPRAIDSGKKRLMSNCCRFFYYLSCFLAEWHKSPLNEAFVLICLSLFIMLGVSLHRCLGFPLFLV